MFLFSCIDQVIFSFPNLLNADKQTVFAVIQDTRCCWNDQHNSEHLEDHCGECQQSLSGSHKFGQSHDCGPSDDFGQSDDFSLSDEFSQSEDSHMTPVGQKNVIIRSLWSIRGLRSVRGQFSCWMGGSLSCITISCHV